jgi:hypothetical protein
MVVAPQKRLASKPNNAGLNRILFIVFLHQGKRNLLPDNYEYTDYYENSGYIFVKLA